MNDYDKFAWIYRQHWDDYTDAVWPVICSLVLPRIPVGERVVDLCCGTGKMAALLWDHGFRVTGIDNSQEMLTFARVTAPDATWLCEDARHFVLDQPVKVVVSLFDSLNHMMSLEDLTQVFSQVWAALDPGGLFFFDMNSIQKYESRWTGQNALIYPDHVAAISRHYDLKTRIAVFDAAVFVQDANTWIRSDVHLTQRAYSLPQIHQALARGGFDNVQVFNGLNDLKVATFYGRLFFLAQKAD